MDNLSPEERSRLMSRVASKNTKPELTVRRILHQIGYRFRLHAPDLPGRPDVVFRNRKKAIFIHGCFWYGHINCRYAKLPRSRVEFWSQKIERNRARDAQTIAELKFMGWKYMIGWQCDLKNVKAVINALKDFLGPRKFSKKIT